MTFESLGQEWPLTFEPVEEGLRLTFEPAVMQPPRAFERVGSPRVFEPVAAMQPPQP